MSKYLILLILITQPIYAADYRPAITTILNTMYKQSNLEIYVDTQEKVLEKNYVPERAKQPGAVVFFLYECATKHEIGWTWHF